MLAPPSLRRRRAARTIWASWGVVCSLFLFFLPEFGPAAGQSVEASSSAGSQSPEQLTRTAQSYENFLHGPGAGPPETRVEVQEHLGAVYFLLHRYRDSLDVLAPVLHDELSPSSKKDALSLRAQSWLVCGLDYLELNQLTDATRVLRRALSMEPDSANARMALGDALARSNRMEDAIREYEEQTRRTPALADVWYKLGLAHSQISVDLSRSDVRPAGRNITQQLAAEELLAKGDNLNAARALFRLAHRSPDQPEVQAELGTALLALGYVTAANDHFQQESIKNPESPLAEMGLVQTAALKADWTQVEAKLEHISQSQPRESARLLELPPAGLVVQAWAASQMKPPPSFAQSPGGMIWQSWLGDSNVVARISDARGNETTNGCPVEIEDLAPGIWLRESCYVRLERRLRAKAHLAPIARVKLAEAEFRLSDYDAALRTAKLLRASDPHSGWAIYWLSKAHDAIAEQCFLKVGALNPDSARVHQMLAERYAKLSDYPKARTEFQKAIQLASDAPDLHLGLGTVLSRSGDWEQAEHELKTALELAPKSAFAHYELGHLYVQQARWQLAIEHLRQIPVDSTVLLSARLDLAKAESEVGETSDALKDLLSVAALDQDGELYFRLAALYRGLGEEGRAHEAMATFKQRRAASLQTDTAEVGALEKEQEISPTTKPKSQP